MPSGKKKKRGGEPVKILRTSKEEHQNSLNQKNSRRAFQKEGGLGEKQKKTART